MLRVLRVSTCMLSDSPCRCILASQFMLINTTKLTPSVVLQSRLVVCEHKPTLTHTKEHTISFSHFIAETRLEALGEISFLLISSVPPMFQTPMESIQLSFHYFTMHSAVEGPHVLLLSSHIIQLSE